MSGLGSGFGSRAAAPSTAPTPWLPNPAAAVHTSNFGVGTGTGAGGLVVGSWPTSWFGRWRSAGRRGRRAGGYAERDLQFRAGRLLHQALQKGHHPRHHHHQHDGSARGRPGRLWKPAGDPPWTRLVLLLPLREDALSARLVLEEVVDLPAALDLLPRPVRDKGVGEGLRVRRVDARRATLQSV